MKYYLIRIREDGLLKWAYLASEGNHKVAYERAKELFGGQLIAFEKAPVTNRKHGKSTYK